MGHGWAVVLDTSVHGDYLDEEKPGPEHAAGETIEVPAWSLRLLRRVA